jgi:hypothetical protein
MNGVVGILVHYVSFTDISDNYSCAAKLVNMEDARKVFQIYCDHLHYNGWKRVKADVLTAMIHEETVEFQKDGISKYVVIDVVEE